MLKALACFIVAIWCVASLNAQTDVFGISKLYPSKQGFAEWTSAHWNNGVDRTITYASDAYDPTNWTEDHSGSSYGFHIDGKGVMTMYGTPRFHVNPKISSKVSAQVFTNIEFTAYYKKTGSQGASYGGMIVGMRGAANGHGSSNGNNCDAQCYMGRFRNDGKWDFEKELKHPATTYYSGSGYMKQDPLWGGKKLPEDKWIGMKYILINVNNTVKMTLYIDTVSNGNPVNGGVWQLVGEVIDNGSNFQGADISGCSYSDKYMPITAGGNVFWRTDNDTAQYKMVSIREIDPVANELIEVTGNKEKFSLRFSSTEINILSEAQIFKVEIIDAAGRMVLSDSSNNNIFDISNLATGVYLLRATTSDGVLVKRFVH